MEPIILPRLSDKKPLVSVISITYNQEPYIRDCLEGFLMQKTDFPVEIIIHDDASTDHTADIIREYYEKRPDLFHVIIERENCFSKHRPIMAPLYEMAQGKYIANCEGDDYWTDPLKLQKQFDFMEKNPDYIMCSGCTQIYIQNSSTYYSNQFFQKSRDLTAEAFLLNGPTLTCTSFFKKETIIDYLAWRKGSSCSRIPIGDTPLFLYFTTHGKCHYENEIVSCYRIHNSSTTHGAFETRLRFLRNNTHIKLKLNREFQIGFPEKRIINCYVYTALKEMIKRGCKDRNIIGKLKRVHKHWSPCITDEFVFFLYSLIVSHPFLYVAFRKGVLSFKKTVLKLKRI